MLPQTSATASTVGRSHVDVAGTIVTNWDGINGASDRASNAAEKEQHKDSNRGEFLLGFAVLVVCVVAVIIYRDRRKLKLDETTDGNVVCETSSESSNFTESDMWKSPLDQIVRNGAGDIIYSNVSPIYANMEVVGGEEGLSVDLTSASSTVHYSLCGANL
jgi:hypothetical protein